MEQGLELHAMCFVFKTAVVFLCKERLRHKKKLMSVVASAKNSTTTPEVEIIRYQVRYRWVVSSRSTSPTSSMNIGCFSFSGQVLIPVTEVQVRTAQAKDMEAHYLWELIHLKNPLHRRSEKVYHLSNRSVLSSLVGLCQSNHWKRVASLR